MVFRAAVDPKESTNPITDLEKSPQVDASKDLHGFCLGLQRVSLRLYPPQLVAICRFLITYFVRDRSLIEK